MSNKDVQQSPTYPYTAAKRFQGYEQKLGWQVQDKKV